MLKLKIRKGYILLETVISLSLVTIFMYCVFLIQFKYEHLRYQNNKLEEDLTCFDQTINYIKGSFSYESLFKAEPACPMYIDANKLDFEEINISDKDIKFLDSSDKNNDSKIQLNITGDEVLTLNFKMKFKVDGDSKDLNYVAYKGRYE